MRRIAHISDLHFSWVDRAVVDGLAAELNGDRPDLVVASGDFTQGARRAEFAEARAFLSRLAPPVLSVPGNHDITPYHLVQRFFDPYRRYRRYIHPEIEPVWRDEEIAVIGVNTARRFALELNWSYGRINARQLRRVRDLLSSLPPNLFRIVVGHHPFLPPDEAPETRVVGGAEEALACFHSQGVGLVLAGHLHRGYARSLRPLVEDGAVTGAVEKPPQASRARRMTVVQAGSATSTRLRNAEPNAYNRITVENGEARIEARLWTGGCFESARKPGVEVEARAAG
jgi:3',5'-cyclic AMP phosphodiesterase CpdA